jgi:hypothetical protein
MKIANNEPRDSTGLTQHFLSFPKKEPVLRKKKLFVFLLAQVFFL